MPLQDGITTLSKAEQACVHESDEKEHLEQLCNIVGFVREADGLSSVSNNNNETEPKKLLPSMNRVWPHLVLCLKHVHTAVRLVFLFLFSPQVFLMKKI